MPVQARWERRQWVFSGPGCERTISCPRFHSREQNKRSHHRLGGLEPIPIGELGYGSSMAVSRHWNPARRPSETRPRLLRRSVGKEAQEGRLSSSAVLECGESLGSIGSLPMEAEPRNRKAENHLSLWKEHDVSRALMRRETNGQGNLWHMPKAQRLC